MLSQDRANALIALLDDEAPATRKALRMELRHWGEQAQLLLGEIVSSGHEPSLVSAARCYLAEVFGSDAIEEFHQFIRSLQYELESGIILLHRVVDPQLEAADICRSLNEISARSRELLAYPVNPREIAAVVNRVVFHEYGYRVSPASAGDPSNSLIGEVIHRRRGSVTMLSLVYFLIARRAGLDCELVALTDRIMVGYLKGSDPFYIDPAEFGRMRGLEEFEDFLSRMGMGFDLAHFAPCPVGDLLLRCCRNLKNTYAANGDFVNERIFSGFVREFDETYRRSASS